jgi:hypothetical protein
MMRETSVVALQTASFGGGDGGFRLVRPCSDRLARWRNNCKMAKRIAPSLRQPSSITKTPRNKLHGRGGKAQRRTHRRILRVTELAIYVW